MHNQNKQATLRIFHASYPLLPPYQLPPLCCLNVLIVELYYQIHKFGICIHKYSFLN